MTDTAGLMHILQICDSLFPVGAFTLSNGLETYVQHDIITSPKGLEEYLHSYISVLPYNELGAAAAAYNADEKELCRLDEIYSAVKTPFEIRSGSEKVTRRFFKICNNGRESFTGLYKSLTEQGICKGHQCIAYGLYMRDNGIELSEGLAVSNASGRQWGSSVKQSFMTGAMGSSLSGAIFHAVRQWLKEQLEWDISPDKVRMINPRTDYSEFLGLKV